MTKPIIKIIGMALSAAGIAVTLLTDWVNEKQMEVMIDEKVNEALADHDNDDEDDEE